ncbi:MAG TPA: LuxR C-terminal-related transcriptional regulator [Saprospiraceae bacterium]|nr:LuxR C-terminal-related transcriptional regulator [Saprospiraceae bacterium]HMP25120.1 LuxR C-terminal-related transcriptional regulator [Saprospiraceae bacterium]
MNLGEAIDPPWSEVRQRWLKAVVHRPPRTVLQLFDAREGCTVRSSGFSLLGYADDREFNTRELLQKTHENQRSLLHYQTERVYQVFVDKPELIKGKGVVYCNMRSFMDAKGEFWRVHQASVPMQFDYAGRLVRYLSYYRIIGKYNGEPFETDIFTDARFPEEERLLKAALKQIKRDLLQGLGFTLRQEEIIRLILKKHSRKDIAEVLKIDPRTVDKHRQAILEKGREIFPLNQFSKADDVVVYLNRQWLL